MKFKKRNLLIALFIFTVIFLLSGKIPPEAVQNFIKDWGILAPIPLIVLSLITYIFAPLSSIPVVIAGFYIYGPKSILFVSIAVWISYVTNFWISRRLGLREIKYVHLKVRLYQPLCYSGLYRSHPPRINFLCTRTYQNEFL